MINEPPSYKTARLLIIGILGCCFIAVVWVNIYRFLNPRLSQHITHQPLDRAQLPVFQISPLNNHTLLGAVNCTLDNRDTVNDLEPYRMDMKLVHDWRLDREGAWRVLQYVPNEARREYGMTLGALEKAYAQYVAANKDELAQHPLPAMDELQYPFLHLFLDNNTNIGVDNERWGVYTFDLRDNQTSTDFMSARQVTCRVGQPRELTVANSTVFTPTVVGPSQNMSIMAQFSSGIAQGNVRKFPLFKGQHTVLTYDVEQHCIERLRCVFLYCTVWLDCTTSYKPAMVNTNPVADGSFLPPSFLSIANQTSVQDYAYVTAQLNLDDQGKVPVTVVTDQRTYGYLEIMASLFSTLTILVLVYKILMGHSKVNPFGVVQRWILGSKTRRFIYHIEREKTRPGWLEDTLFTIYLENNGIHEQDATSTKGEMAV